MLLPTEQNKLTLALRGPYKVVGTVGEVDYKIEINPGKVKTYHINMLKQYFHRENEENDVLRNVHCGSKNAPTLADYNYDPVQSILILFSTLFVNDHKSCLVVKFSTSPHVCCHYTL